MPNLLNKNAVKKRRIDLLPNYGPGTSKRYRKSVTSGNTFISYCEKRNFRSSSDLAEAKIYLFVVRVIFDMPSTNHFFWSFCSQVGMTIVLVGFSGLFAFGRSELLCRDFDKVSNGLDLFFFFFFFYSSQTPVATGQIVGSLVVGLDTLGRPEVSASSCV